MTKTQKQVEAIGSVEDLIESIDPETNPQEWEIVPDSLRTSPRAMFVMDDLTTALTENKTVKVPVSFGIHKVYRWAKANGYRLHTRQFREVGFRIMWFTKNEVTE